MNEVTAISAFQLTDTPTPVGWRYAQITDQWLVSSTANGVSVLTSEGGSGEAIAEVLQGTVLFDSAPDYLGMPTQNTPICDVIYMPSAITDGYNAFFRIISVIDDNTILVANPSGVTIGKNDAYVLCSRFKPVRGLDVNNLVGSDFDMYNLNGTYAQFISPPLTLIGQLDPILFLSSNGSKPIVQITY